MAKGTLPRGGGAGNAGTSGKEGTLGREERFLWRRKESKTAVPFPLSPPPPPRDLGELETRARALAGRSLNDLAEEHAIAFAGRAGARTKGKTGELVEQILGAEGGSARVHDFPALGVELKTIPVDAALRPRESTYVCTLQLAEADRAEWATSWVRAKLAHVLWVPIVTAAGEETRVGECRFWVPTAEQLAVLAGDFEEILGAIAIGGIEQLTARTGRWLQVRPKGASGRDRTWSVGADESWVRAVPRGFYLRTTLTKALLRDVTAVP
jgi:DNA mismatch repair protein MutH